MENVIINKDCLEALPTLPDNSVQLVLVDLPYGQTACDWDTKINLDRMWKQLKRVLKPNGQCLFFTTTKFGNELINSETRWFRSDIVWEKANAVGHLSAKKALLRKHEMIYLFHNSSKPKGTKWIYNPQMVKGEPYSRGNIQKKEKDTIYGKEKKYSHENLTGDRYPTSIIKLGNTANSIHKLHATQKPVELCEWLIKTYSNEGDMVLDFTMGSGSTIIACINTNRKYIGIEMNKTIFETAEKRINERLELK